MNWEIAHVNKNHNTVLKSALTSKNRARKQYFVWPPSGDIVSCFGHHHETLSTAWFAHHLLIWKHAKEIMPQCLPIGQNFTIPGVTYITGFTHKVDS